MHFFLLSVFEDLTITLIIFEIYFNNLSFFLVTNNIPNTKSIVCITVMFMLCIAPQLHDKTGHVMSTLRIKYNLFLMDG